METENKVLDPTIEIDGKVIRPAEPKMRVWREFLAFFEQDKGELPLDEFLSAHVRLIVLAFGREEVTVEVVEDSLAIADIVPFTRELFRWLQSRTFAKLMQLPNAVAEAGAD